MLRPLVPPLFPRRALLLAAAASPWLVACAARTGDAPLAHARAALADLEASADGRLGVCAFGAPGGPVLRHRADERFPLCSTFKAVAAAAVLDRSRNEPGLMEQVVAFDAADLVPYSPVTSRFAGRGMNYDALCAAALQHSDNTAGNLLLRAVGGPAGLSAYARALGDGSFRLDRWETALNDAIPGDPRDTATPQGMARSLQRLLLGDALPPPQRARLAAWMRGNTTGDARIRAGAPAGWTVADKTGSGDYGTANDIGVAWPPAGPPLTIAVYFTQDRQPPAGTPYRSDVIAAATRIAVRALA
jgi:beta-lactamase class A